jgi:uncharacterized protein YegL
MSGRRLPVYLALDCSSSMTGESIETVQDSVATLIHELQLRQSENSDIWLSIIAFDTEANELQPLMPVTQSEPVALNASGGTELNSALKLLNRKIRSELSDESRWREPEVVLMTDGKFGSGWESESAELKERAGNVIGLAIGEDADVTALQKVSSNVALIRETFSWVGDVIRVAATGGEGRVYPAPPSSISHLPGTSAGNKSRRWGDDSTLSKEELERFREEELLRRREEDKRRLEAIKRREEEAVRRQQEQEREQRRIDRIRSLISFSDQNQDTQKISTLSRNTSSAQTLAKQLKKSCTEEIRTLTLAAPRPTASSLATRCGLYLMSIQGAEAATLQKIVDELITLSVDCTSIFGHNEVWLQEFTEAEKALKILHSEAEPSDAGVYAYAAGMRILNVLSILESQENDQYPKRLLEIVDLMDKDLRAANRELNELGYRKGIDLPAYRIAALTALERAASTIIDSGDLERVESYLQIAHCASASGSDLVNQILLLDVARTIIAESRETKDEVVCTVFSPPWIKRSTRSLIQVVLHLPRFGADAEISARESDPRAERRGYQRLELPVKRGDQLGVSLTSGNLDVVDPVKIVTWRGDLLNVQFLVNASDAADVDQDCLSVTIWRTEVPLGTIHFSLQVVPNSPMITGGELVPTGRNVHRIRKAFVSYATVDRKAALERTRILASVGIDVFIDSLTLDPGDRWEQGIYNFIDCCDLFYLIWSKSSKSSKWVKKETLRALSIQRQANNDVPVIVPIVLPPPPPPSPWKELSHLQFNDHINYYEFMQPRKS